MPGHQKATSPLLNPGVSFVMITMRCIQTAMPMLPDYELLEVLTEEEPRTFRARQVSSGRIVLLHRLSGGPSYPGQAGLIRTVVRYLRQASTASRGLVLDMVEHNGVTYLVTELPPGFRTFNHWLASELKVPEEAQDGSPRVTAPAQPPEGGASKSPTQPLETNPHSGSEEAGEFTRMFQGPVVASHPPSRGGVAQLGSEKVPPSPRPGIPTGILQPSEVNPTRGLATEVPKGASEKVAAPPESGEFTGIFQVVDRSNRVPVEGPEAPLDKSAASPQPGEFTRLFQAPVVDKPGPGPAEPPDSISGISPTPPSEFTAIFKSSTGDERPGALDIQPSTPKEVGDFTRMFGSPGATEPSSARLPTNLPAEPTAPPQPTDDESALRPQALTGIKPQPAAQPGPQGAPINPPKVGERPPLPVPRVPSISPPKVPDKPTLPVRPAPTHLQHVPPVIASTEATKAPQPVPPKMPSPELPTSDKRTSYLPWVLILGGLVLLGVVLIVYVFTRS